MQKNQKDYKVRDDARKTRKTEALMTKIRRSLSRGSAVFRLLKFSTNTVTNKHACVANK